MLSEGSQKPSVNFSSPLFIAVGKDKALLTDFKNINATVEFLNIFNQTTP